MKKRICIITTSFPRFKNDSMAGGEFVKNFALSLVEKNCDIFVLTPFKEGSKNDDKRITVHFFPWIGSDLGLSSLNPRNPVYLVKLLSVIISGIFSSIKFIKKNKIELCFAAWAVPSGIFALFAKIFCKTPYFVWALGSDVYKIQDYPFGKFILKKVFRNANKLFADGIELSQIVEQISGRKCEFLSSNRILNTKQQEIDYAKFSPTKINFMFLGRYHESKGVDLLIEAIGRLDAKEREKCLFHIFGGGPLEEKIKQMVKKLDLESNTFVNGYVDSDKVFSYMSRSDYIVIPSRSDSISLVLFEAVQANKPVVATSVGDVATLLNRYKVGFLVDCSSDGIAEGLREAIRVGKTQLNLFSSAISDLKSFLDPQKSVKTFIESVQSVT